MTKERKPTVTLTLTEHELYLLSNGFSTSYQPGGEGNEDMDRISDKLNRADERLRSIMHNRAGKKRRTVGFVP